MSKPAKSISLKARAVDFLSRREHSRLELQTKLARYSDDIDEINIALDELQKDNWQSDTRYAFAYANKNSSKHGVMRILNDLRHQGINEVCINEIRDSLSDSEYQRALLVWQKKFGSIAENPKAYAKQYRFMLGRGFSNDCINKILSGKTPD